MIKKSHFLYALISVCALGAYLGFIFQSSVTDVNTHEETLPYEPTAPAVHFEATEAPTRAVTLVKTDVPHVAPTEEPPTQSPTEPPTALAGFSPIFPVEGNISEEFSLTPVYNPSTRDWRSHTGIDIAAPLADAVSAVEDGTVIKAYEDSIWGNVIEIDHGEYTSIYKNLSTLIMVKAGDNVRRGEKISGVGQSCGVENTAPHLHFELTYYGELIDPVELLG